MIGEPKPDEELARDPDWTEGYEHGLMDDAYQITPEDMRDRPTFVAGFRAGQAERKRREGDEG